MKLLSSLLLLGAAAVAPVYVVRNDLFDFSFHPLRTDSN